jgi:probable rRNA maturation factor
VKLRLTTQYAVSARGLPTPRHLRRWARAALRGLRRRGASVNVRIVGREESRTLNARYRRKNKPTNVLSFPFETPPGLKSDLLGDLVLCAPVVRREAREQAKPEMAHWAHLVVHGIMHLRGYGHDNDKQAAVMERRETRLLRDLGFPDPYA